QTWDYDQASGEDVATAIGVDGNDRIYVAGYVSNPLTGKDYVTIRLNPNGGITWTRLYYSAWGGEDKATAMAVTNSGLVYVPGLSGPAGTPDYVTVAYRWDSLVLW